MKYALFFALFCWTQYSFAQLYEGFNPEEVRDLSALCSSFTFENLYGSDKEIIPRGYTKVFTSPVIGMDNKFQVYEKGKIGIINFRGSTDKVSSWVENIYSAMIPAQGTMKIDKKDTPYNFSTAENAAVHSGYSLAIVLLSPLIVDQIQKLNQKGIHHILITGHSQGGALANLCRAYVEQLPAGTISSKNIFKTYAFACPMAGNKVFSEDYAELYADNNMSYTIINPADLVPSMPMHYDDKGKIFSKDRIKKWLSGQEAFNLRKVGTEFLVKKFEKSLKGYVNASNKILEKAISTNYQSIEMPAYVDDINYYQIGNVRELQAFEYPKIKLDPSTLTEKELSKLKPDEDGNYYKKEPSFYQHKPYNYYVGVLKEYFSREYKKLAMKQLPENL